MGREGVGGREGSGEGGGEWGGGWGGRGVRSIGTVCLENGLEVVVVVPPV